ncbi:hypothetical protein LTR84_012782 [Exophiala bonariae]|uniref:Enoyl reductase (ER) domain-containing protein n=1 Tax=Exophiala bonariae TaxID=1690606 RepID=A0AAV9NH93_9EURO|nr:hypothetical protein LTR84_012782 [Exophiala bonariae]
MAVPTETKCWVMARKPQGLPTYSGKDATFELLTKALPELQPNQVLVEALYLSNDPAQRTWMSLDVSAKRHYVPPIEFGSVMRARGIVKVLRSTSKGFKEGDLGYGPVGWSAYGVLDADSVRPLSPLPGGMDMTLHVGTLGLTGMTAYYGLIEIVQAKEGETILISGAAGATGSMAVRIAKHLVKAGKIIGIAGTDEKCRWVEKLGADLCLNYKSPTFGDDLAKATEDKLIDVFFDNVGGEMLDSMLSYMAMYGRVALCGAISIYNSSSATLLKNFPQLITMRLNLRGFVVHDFSNDEAKREQFIQAMLESDILTANDGIQDTVVTGIVEDIPKIWLRLFDGGNQGKLITKLE